MSAPEPPAGPCSTVDRWRDVQSGICVLPVGSCEQHSHHLPVGTDTILAEYFAAFLAEALGAALLPTLAVATSLEHSGFRGSFSLRPETLMAVIRDLADEAERQDFTTLIVLNGHGGNFSLAPVIRDINRVDRPIKVLLVHCYEFSDPVLKPDDPDRPSIHAGAWETSLMLALRPDLVGRERADVARPEPEAHPLVRADLNTFGISYFSPEGAVGTPSRATRGTGEKIVASIKANMLPFVRDRLARLHEKRVYQPAARR